MPFCDLCASKGGTFERENCAPKRPARFRGPRSRVRDIFGAGNHHSAVLNGSADVYTGKASEFVDKTNKKPRSRWAGGSKSMAVKPTDDSTDQKQKRNKKEKQDR